MTNPALFQTQKFLHLIPVKDIVIEDVVVHANPIADEEGH
ncbi:unnamed protein product [Amoebophrya sp. A120]|nr:unnamed protein product [Amoebophrya sp. A120]|eukprot:GSA120T00022938001.1